MWREELKLSRTKLVICRRWVPLVRLVVSTLLVMRGWQSAEDFIQRHLQKPDYWNWSHLQIMLAPSPRKAGISEQQNCYQHADRPGEGSPHWLDTSWCRARDSAISIPYRDPVPKVGYSAWFFLLRARSRKLSLGYSAKKAVQGDTYQNKTRESTPVGETNLETVPSRVHQYCLPYRQ